MSYFIHAIAVPPKVLSEQEQAALLTTTGQRRGAFRDHLIIALALATGLRQHEIAALDVGDVYDETGKPKLRLVLRVFKGVARHPAPQEVLLNETIRTKLAAFHGWKHRHGESVDPGAPVFLSRLGKRISKRQMRHMFRVWQQRSGIQRPLGFHSLRHSSCTAVYRQNRDLRLVQRFSRHRSLLSVERYAHPSEEDLLRALQQLRC